MLDISKVFPKTKSTESYPINPFILRGVFLLSSWLFPMGFKAFICIILVLVSYNCIAGIGYKNDDKCLSNYIQKRCLSGNQPSYFVAVPANSDDQRHIEFFLSNARDLIGTSFQMLNWLFAFPVF